MHLSLIQRAVIVALGGFIACNTATTAQAQQVQTVFVISMENHNLTQPVPLSNPQQIKGNVAAPFLNSLMTPGNPNAVQTSFATNYQNVGSGIHPSAPNYIWSQGGSNFGVLNDNNPYGTGGTAQTTSQNLSNYLQTAGIAWKAYEEDIDINLTNNTALPNSQWTVPLLSVSGTFASGTNAYNGSNQYSYDVNHDPMVYFTDTDGGNDSSPNNPFAHNYAPLQQLQTDLANGTVARYNWITPDIYNTAHSSLPGGFTYHGTHYTGDQAAVAQGDNFLSILIPQIEASQAYLNNGVIIIWFDETEGGDTSAYTIPEIIISPLAIGNAYSSGLFFTHSSDLLTTEEIFGVGPCIRGACGANDLSDLFQPGAIESLTSISPLTGSQGSSVPVTLTGYGFVAPLTVNVSGSGITVSNVSVVSSTQVTAMFNIAANAATGNRSVWVSTPGGTSGNVTFDVTAAVGAPTLTSVSPSTGSQGSSVPVTLTGNGFVAPLTVNLSGSGITVSNVTVVSSTQVTAMFNIAANAATGGQNVSVTTAAGTSGTVPFTVNAAGLPTLTSIVPSTGALGTSVNVTLTGTNFTTASQVRLQGGGLTQTNIVVVSPTQITATYNISSSAATGAHNTWVVTSGGSSNILTFTVTGTKSTPTLTSVTPNSGTQGTAVNVTLAGTNFIAGATVGATGSGITVSNVTVASGTQITATLTLAANATLGPSSISVTTSGGVSNTVPFTVNAAVPTLTSVTPNSGMQGTAVNVTLTGSGFITGATVGTTGSGITVNNVVVASATQITATLNVAANATPGAYNVSVTTTGGTSNTAVFTVNAVNGLPTLTSVTPSSGARGTSVNVTLTGTNFTSASQVRLQGGGLTQTNIAVVSSTQITATYNISSSVATGPHNTWIVTSAGSSNILTFTVN
ncbi:MAG TPA: IPT/TIG domain-containing protein [Candidatus Angelobacter sp.]|nr:IPT/TIG domain-containing protein [Candidatus Angelobacter sp.]